MNASDILHGKYEKNKLPGFSILLTVSKYSLDSGKSVLFIIQSSKPEAPVGIARPNKGPPNAAVGERKHYQVIINAEQGV